MPRSIDSSSDSDHPWHDVEQAVSEEDITGAAWYERSSEGDETPSLAAAPNTVKISARAYQLEMLEASLKENIILAADTGSGKTMVAVLRIREELKTLSPDKIIWFLAPTVSLCAQQYEVISTQIPSVYPKIITGSDKVDSWSSSTWDGILLNVKVVLSTHQVLLDALLHGFVQISSLALLVFDEAHHCSKNHPYARIMKEFYWQVKAQGNPVPHILGMTASPVVRSDVSSLEKIEATLDAVCRSPVKHREELLAHSQRPILFSVPYATNEFLPKTKSMEKLEAARDEAKKDIKHDPYIVSLLSENTERSKRKLKEAIYQNKTYVQESLKTFCRRSGDIAKDLGSWAADWYIYETIRRFLAGVPKQGAASKSFRDSEVVYLARKFMGADIDPPPPLGQMSDLSDRVKRLIDVLLKYEGDARGIVFVKERATTVVLAHILSAHPEIKKKYRLGTMVGTSSVPGVKRDFLDLPEKTGAQSLEDFRMGKKNLLVATSVLEEGIDVPACNLVICVDKPSNLKSFIQRRGRARMRESHLYLFMDEQDKSSSKGWEILEAEMKRHYEDEMRKLQEIEELEDSEPVDYPELRVESTGARLTINDAKSHLQHFCATLSSRKYVDYQPDYIIEQMHDSARPGAPVLLKATVVLPVSVAQEVRQATSSRMWLSERLACMDAAFQAYKALYQAGLLDDHLLPLKESLELEDRRPGMTDARALYNPWSTIASDWSRSNSTLHRRAVKVLDQNGSVMCDFELVLPDVIPDMKPMAVWWDYDTQLTFHIDEDLMMKDEDDTRSETDHLSILLTLAYSHRRMVIKDDCVMRLISSSSSLSMKDIGNVPFTPDIVTGPGHDFVYLVRDGRELEYHHPYYYDAFIPTKPTLESVQKVYKGFEEEPEDMPYLAVKKWPRKTGFFHRPVPPQHLPSTKPYSRILPATTAVVDSIPLVYAKLGLLIPSLFHFIELYLLATELSRTLLAPLKLSDISMVVEAICAKSARTPTNYERVEFLGDSILKTCVTVSVAATNLRFTEGLLSLLKDRVVSNSRLYMAARQSALDKFIVTQQLVLKGWRAPYISDLISGPPQDTLRTLSTKTLADVVEAVIGISYLDGGLSKALHCIDLFLPESQIKSFDVARDILCSSSDENHALPADLKDLEQLIGYEFRRKGLLDEATIHPSYNVPRVHTCFDRLEFIGDAILDYIVVQEIYAVNDPAPLENWQMHLYRTALVNADILGFLVMEFNYSQQRYDVKVDNSSSDDSSSSSGSSGPELTETKVAIPLWSFMRQSSAELVMEREATGRRHAELRGPILEAMRTGTHYPWALLARLHAQKFYSDLFEALVGAIWVDSGPEFDACRTFVEKSEVLPYFRRLLRDHVHVLHPKEELGRLADREKVEYVVEEVDREDGDGREWACAVKIGTRSVVSVSGCLFKEEAKVTAATEAVRLLKGW